MKKILLLFLLIIASTVSWGQIQYTNYDNSVSVIRDGYSMVPLSPYRFTVVGSPNGKYGFATNDSNLTLTIDTIYEDVFIGGGGLVGVKYNGKWGIFDIKLHNSNMSEQPIVKCEYDKVETFDDYTARLTKGGATYIFDIRQKTRIVKEK